MGKAKQQLQELSSSASMHGVNRTMGPENSMLCKGLWGLVIVVCFILCIYQLTHLITFFLSYPVTVSVSMGSKSMAFPAVTICNLNPYKVSMLKDVPELAGLVDFYQKTARQAEEANRRKRSVADTASEEVDPILSRVRRAASSNSTNSSNVNIICGDGDLYDGIDTCYTLVSMSIDNTEGQANCTTPPKIETAMELRAMSLMLNQAYPNISSVWIGVDDLATSGTYYYSSTTESAFVTWSPGEPSSSQKCVQLDLSTQKYIPVDCTENSTAFCTYPVNRDVGTHACWPGYIELDQVCYRFTTETSSWYGGRTICKNELASLPQFRAEATYQAFYDFMVGSSLPQEYWIGMRWYKRFEAITGGALWSDSYPGGSTWEDWHGVDLKQSLPFPTYHGVVTSEVQNSSGWFTELTSTIYPIVCQYTPEYNCAPGFEYDGVQYCYKNLNVSASFYDALMMCEELNLTLPMVKTDRNLNALVNRDWGTNTAWLGMLDEAIDGTWHWILDNSESNLTQWVDGSTFDDNTLNNCAILDFAQRGIMDVDCKESHPVICQYDSNIVCKYPSYPLEWGYRLIRRYPQLINSDMLNVCLYGRHNGTFRVTCTLVNATFADWYDDDAVCNPPPTTTTTTTMLTTSTSTTTVATTTTPIATTTATTTNAPTTTIQMAACPLPVVSNGNFIISQGGLVASFSCETGYALTGSDEIDCDLQKEVWKQTIPDCSQLTNEVMAELELVSPGIIGDSANDPQALLQNIQEITPYFISMLPERSVIDIGHQFYEMFEFCFFDGEPCHMKDFAHQLDPSLGNCYTFNPKIPPEFSTRQAGANRGLILQMFTNQSDYLPISPKAGFQLIVHNQNEVIFPDNQGAHITTGAKLSIGIKKTDIIRLPSPYGTCIETPENYPFYFGEKFYSSEGCFRSCIQAEVMKSCSCWNPLYPVPTNGEPCKPSKRWCVNEMANQSREALEAKCDSCPIQCRQSVFELITTHASWPIKTTELYRANCLLNNTTMTDDYCLEDLRKNYLFLEAYFVQLNYHSVEENAGFTAVNLVSSLGNIFGLWLGMSVISYIELVVFTVLLVTSCVRP